MCRRQPRSRRSVLPIPARVAACSGSDWLAGPGGDEVTLDGDLSRPVRRGELGQHVVRLLTQRVVLAISESLANRSALDLDGNELADGVEPGGPHPGAGGQD